MPDLQRGLGQGACVWPHVLLQCQGRARAAAGREHAAVGKRKESAQGKPGESARRAQGKRKESPMKAQGKRTPPAVLCSFFLLLLHVGVPSASRSKYCLYVPCTSEPNKTMVWSLCLWTRGERVVHDTCKLPALTRPRLPCPTHPGPDRDPDRQSGRRVGPDPAKEVDQTRAPRAIFDSSLRRARMVRAPAAVVPRLPIPRAPAPLHVLLHAALLAADPPCSILCTAVSAPRR